MIGNTEASVNKCIPKINYNQKLITTKINYIVQKCLTIGSDSDKALQMFDEFDECNFKIIAFYIR